MSGARRRVVAIASGAENVFEVFTNGEPTQSRKRLLMEREAGARLCSSLTSLRLREL